MLCDTLKAGWRHELGVLGNCRWEHSGWSTGNADVAGNEQRDLLNVETQIRNIYKEKCMKLHFVRRFYIQYRTF